MDWERVFSTAGQIAMAGWLILLFAPRRWPMLNLVPQLVLPGVLSLGYGVLILVYFAGADGGFDSLASVRRLMSSGDPVLLAGWVHYLAFDLFVGAWLAARCDRQGISRLVQVPILASTFLFGPLGLVSYLMIAAPWSALRARSTMAEG